MKLEDKLAIAKNRLHKMMSNGKNVPSGPMRKLKRQIRSMESKLETQSN